MTIVTFVIPDVASKRKRPSLLMRAMKSYSGMHVTRSLYITASGETELYTLAREESSADLMTLASLHGAVAGSYGRAQMQKPAQERDLRPTSQRIQEYREVATEVITAAPAFMCSGRLTGRLAAFADCFALAVLSTPEASAGRTTPA